VLGLVALALANAAPAASPEASPALPPTSPWWEKITYTISGDGKQETCQFESSLAGGRTCEGQEASSPIRAASGAIGTYAKITIERRFTPDRPPRVSLQPGDTLLGSQVMALAIDGAGTVRSCEVVGASGEMRPSYGCKEARAERFAAGASQPTPQVRHAFMIIVAYGHEERLA
jgi:hypothetical protein